MMMLSNIFVLLDASAISFCHYETSGCASTIMALETLRTMVKYAHEKRVSLTFLLGEKPLPQEYHELIEEVSGIKIGPPSVACGPFDISVIGLSSATPVNLFDKPISSNVIVRVDKDGLGHLHEVIDGLNGKVSRLTIILSKLDTYTDEELATYKEMLMVLVPRVGRIHAAGLTTEINVLTDRSMLEKMNNCNAGITHFTVAPNGLAYICPGFYYEDIGPVLGSIGDGWEIPNRNLLALESAPICRCCDAFQCKRCVFLNIKSTGEVNTPSRQQCIAAHTEREASMNLLESETRNGGCLSAYAGSVQPVGYIDPLDALERNRDTEQV
jgi:CXXX repeat peptide maturase